MGARCPSALSEPNPGKWKWKSPVADLGFGLCLHPFIKSAYLMKPLPFLPAFASSPFTVSIQHGGLLSSSSSHDSPLSAPIFIFDNTLALFYAAFILREKNNASKEVCGVGKGKSGCGLRTLKIHFHFTAPGITAPGNSTTKLRLNIQSDPMMRLSGVNAGDHRRRVGFRLQPVATQSKLFSYQGV